MQLFAVPFPRLRNSGSRTSSCRSKAVLIGINYKDKTSPLYGSVNDALCIEQFLASQGMFCVGIMDWVVQVRVHWRMIPRQLEMCEEVAVEVCYNCPIGLCGGGQLLFSKSRLAATTGWFFVRRVLGGVGWLRCGSCGGGPHSPRGVLWCFALFPHGCLVLVVAVCSPGTFDRHPYGAPPVRTQPDSCRRLKNRDFEATDSPRGPVGHAWVIIW